MKERTTGASAAKSRGKLLVLDSLPPELESNFKHIQPRLVLSVNDPSLFQTAHGEAALTDADEDIVLRETEHWLERMLRFYPAILRPLLRGVGQRAARRHVNLMRRLTTVHDAVYYVSWGYKDLSNSIARHFVPADRRIEFENGFFRQSCLSVTNKPLLRELGIETVRRWPERRRLGSRFKVLHPQFWEDGVTYYQAIRRRLLVLARRKESVPTAANEGGCYDVLLILQLDFDSATVQNGNGWSSLKLLQFVTSVVSPERILVRPHPFERSGKVRQIKRLAKRSGCVISHDTLEQDMALARFVVTINSSVIGDCLFAHLPFFYAGIIPEELRPYGRPIEELPAALREDLRIGACQTLPENFDPAELLGHVAVQDAGPQGAHAGACLRK